jgi:hypothetical protein
LQAIGLAELVVGEEEDVWYVVVVLDEAEDGFDMVLDEVDEDFEVVLDELEEAFVVVVEEEDLDVVVLLEELDEGLAMVLSLSVELLEHGLDDVCLPAA